MTDIIKRSTTEPRAMTGGMARRGPRRVAGLAAIAVLGLALLTGVGFRQTRQEAQPAAPAAAVNPYWVYTEDVAIYGNPATVAYPAAADDPGARPVDASTTTDYRWALPPGVPGFVADEVTDRDNQDCAYASSTGVPGEGCNR